MPTLIVKACNRVIIAVGRTSACIDTSEQSPRPSAQRCGRNDLTTQSVIAVLRSRLCLSETGHRHEYVTCQSPAWVQPPSLRKRPGDVTVLWLMLVLTFIG